MSEPIGPHTMRLWEAADECEAALAEHARHHERQAAEHPAWRDHPETPVTGTPGRGGQHD